MIGVIADDYTGGTDVAVALCSQGLRTLLFFGVPPDAAELPGHEAVVVALKTRAAPAGQAVSQSLAALEWLRRDGTDQVYVKYCSTFDSTPLGNIGPVLDAVADALSAETVAMTPSSPRHGRTQYQGHLFVGGTLLAESPMRDHPVNPMRDSNLPRLLRAQTNHSVGVLTLDAVRGGDLPTALSTAAARYLLVDAIDEDDLTTIGRALRDAPLVAGAAGLARGLATARARKPGSTVDPPVTGPAAVLSGSCSARTLEQVAAMISAGRPAYRLDPVIQPDPEALATEALAWYDDLPGAVAPLVYSSMGPVDLQRTQELLGAGESARILEQATGLIAVGLVRRGVRRLVVAGGETSGAVVEALGITGGVVGREQAPGVPWIHPVDRPELALLLKSGNFGEPGLLVTASEVRE